MHHRDYTQLLALEMLEMEELTDDHVLLLRDVMMEQGDKILSLPEERKENRSTADHFSARIKGLNVEHSACEAFRKTYTYRKVCLPQR